METLFWIGYWLALISGWFVAFCLIQRRKAKPKRTPEHDEAIAARDEARRWVLDRDAMLIRARQDLDREKKYRTDAEAELAQANEVNTGLVGDLKKVKAERDVLQGRLDRIAAECPVVGVNGG